MDAIDNVESNGDTDSPSNDAVDFFAFRTWVDHIIGDEVTLAMGLRALSFSGVIFGLGSIVAFAGGDGRAYLRSPSAYLVWIGILLTTLSYGWGSRKFLSVWHDIRGAFAISDEKYTDAVTDGLTSIYNDRAIFAEFVFALVGISVLQFAVPIPAAIPVGFDTFLELRDITIQYNDILQHLIGTVVLLFVVTGIHMVVHALRLFIRVIHFPLADPRAAAIELEPIADFSAIAASLWFLVVLLIVAVYRPWIQYLFELGDAFDIGFWVGGSVIALILVGVGIFLIPQIALHSALVERKHERLLELDQELDALVEEFRGGERDPDGVSMVLELYDRRRKRVENTRTWLINIRRLLHLIGSGIAATLSLVSQAITLPWI